MIRSYLGRDASDAFSAFHDQKTWLKLKDFYVGDIQEGEKEAAAESPMAHAFRDLRAEFVKEGLFDSSGLYYLWKVASTLALCAAALVVLARWAPESRLGFYASAALMGLFFQQTGWYVLKTWRLPMKLDLYGQNVLTVSQVPPVLAPSFPVLSPGWPTTTRTTRSSRTAGLIKA